MIEVSDNGERLDITSPMPWGKRLLFALLALFPLIAPYELMLRVGWTDYWHPFFALAALISAGAVALSGFFVFAAVAGLSTRMTLDAVRATFTYTQVALVVPKRSQVFPLSSVQSVHVRTYEWSEGAPSYSLMVEMSDGSTFECGSSWSREDIERGKARVDVFLERGRHGRQPPQPPP